MNKALVSVVIPVWNTAKYVKRLIERLFSQTYKNIEIITIDDDSSDNSLQVLQALSKKDARLKVIHQKNAGVSVARNAGIKAARGEYIIFLDSDDDITEDLVEKLVQKIEEKPDTALVVTGIRYHRVQMDTVEDIYLDPRCPRRKNERMTDYVLWLLILDGRMYSAVNKIFRLSVIKKHELEFEEGRKFAEDTNFVLNYLEVAPGEIEFILEPLYTYNFGTETSTVKASSKEWANWKRSYEDLKKWAKHKSGGKLALKTRGLLGLVWMRWHVSHYRARRRG